MFTARLHIQQIKYPLDDQPMWLNDHRNTQYSEQRHNGTHTKKSCADYVRACSRFWGIQEIDKGEWIGTMAAHIDEENEIAELGILIHLDYAGNGYGTEAWEAVMDHLLSDLRKIETGLMAANVPMKRICEKTKMIFEGERKNHFLLNGGPIGLLQYAKWRKP